MLRGANIAAPVPLTVGWTPSQYGAGAKAEVLELKRQLEASGLFRVTLRSAEWPQYQQLTKTGAYDLYQAGWIPEYPDADDYTSPFYLPDSFLNIHYDNPQMNKLIAEEKASDEPSVRQKAFD